MLFNLGAKSKELEWIGFLLVRLYSRAADLLAVVRQITKDLCVNKRLVSSLDLEEKVGTSNNLFSKNKSLELKKKKRRKNIIIIKKKERKKQNKKKEKNQKKETKPKERKK